MTSEERKEIRYQRRKAKRDRKVLERSRKYGNLEQAFCVNNQWKCHNKLSRLTNENVIDKNQIF